MSDAPVVIAGAGPTGLAAALFLAREGIKARLIDKEMEPAKTSKALAVNPRTLELLQPTGLSAAIESEGRKIGAFELRRNDRTIFSMDISTVHPRFAMTVLPQSRTEALLTQALAAIGIHPERGVALESVENRADEVVVQLKHADGQVEQMTAAILFGADGAHSRTREVLKLEFPGSTFEEPWKLVDVAFTEPVDRPEGYVELHPAGLFFALAFGPKHWRYISSIGDPMERLPRGANVREVTWKSDFRISHRIASNLNVGRVCLGGDAAHLHSPVGARGMNLGIEDAFVFAACAADALSGRAHRLDDYGRIRHHHDLGVVRRVEAITRMARGEGLWSIVQHLVPPIAQHVPALRDMIRQTVTGLDHAVSVR